MNISELSKTGVYEIQSLIAVPAGGRKSEITVCLEDIRFSSLMDKQMDQIAGAIKFVSPLVGKTVRIDGITVHHDVDQDRMENTIRVSLDYEEIK